MDRDHISTLLAIARSPSDYADVQKEAARLLAEYGVVWPHSGCAANLGTLLRRAGIDVEATVGAGRLAHLLGGAIGSRGWIHVPVGSQQPGDVGVTFDWKPPEGSDHVYLVVERIDSDRMTIADNQAPTLHQRCASGRAVPGGSGTTPTDYFLRAPSRPEMTAHVPAGVRPALPHAHDLLGEIFGTDGILGRLFSLHHHAGSTAAATPDVQPTDWFPPSTAFGATAAAQEIGRLAASSAAARVEWANRGGAPLGYVKGMAVVWARVYAKWKTGDEAARLMATADRNLPDKDALSWYADLFAKAHMANDQDGVDTLRHLFVLLVGLGMRESTGRYCEGRDRSAANVTAGTAEAGPFQTSWNIVAVDRPHLVALRDAYAERTDLIEIFKEGVNVRPSDLENYGAGDGLAYQRLAKTCPAFAAEFTALAMRSGRKHWGPITRREAELMPEWDALFRAVGDLSDRRGWTLADL